MNKPGKAAAALAASGDLARLKAELEAAVRERDDHRIATLLTLEDLEENRKRIERSREEWIRVFDGVRDPIFVHDSDFCIVRCNRAYAERAGMSIQQVIGKRYWEVFPKRDGPLPGCVSLEEAEGEVRLDSGDIFLSRSFPVNDAAGAFLFAVHIMDDITERKRVEEAMVKAGEEFHMLFDAIADAIFIADTKGRFLQVNHSACRRLGYSREELLRMGAADIDTPEYAAQLPERIKAVQQRGQLVFESAHVRKDGRVIPIELSVRLVDYGGEPALLSVARDITERKETEKKRQHDAETLRRSLEHTIRAIAHTVEMRDPYTAGHQRRVADLAAAIAKELGLPAEQIHGLHLAGIVHDLGKVSIPSEILSKPGKITDIEFSLIKDHPQAGYDILKDVEFPWPIAQTVLQHHERLDGSGYPQGLKAEQILLDARILAVADVVEAMASHRPYRASLGIDKALAEIEQGRGRAYDPASVDACVKLFREKSFTFAN